MPRAITRQRKLEAGSLHGNEALQLSRVSKANPFDRDRRNIPMPRILIVLALALLALGGCDGGHGDAAQKMEVRVYQVPPDSTNALMQTLNKVFETGDKTTLGKVSSPSPGQLVVLAPASLQGSVEASLRALAKDAAPIEGTPHAANRPDAPLRLSFWSVDAVPLTDADDPTLAALAAPLEEVRKQLGTVHFELRDEVSALSSPGQPVDRSWLGATGLGGSPQVKQLRYTLKKNAGDLSLSINFGDQIPVPSGGGNAPHYLSTGTETTTTIRLGQTLVVTQSPIPDNEAPGGTSNSLTRLYLVRVDEVPAG
jgi:hypothetical protein